MAVLRFDELDDKYGKWTPLREGDRKGKSKYRTVICQCDCGTVKQVNFNALVNHKTHSCGCTKTKHGECGSRLYNCWRAMTRRSRERTRAGEVCNVHRDWLSFDGFSAWALDNGYSDDKILCRDGDVGDYSPDNARWDTPQANTEEWNAKSYTMISPDGVVTEIFNMAKFCKDNNLSAPSMHRVCSGQYKHHKGWKI